MTSIAVNDAGPETMDWRIALFMAVHAAGGELVVRRGSLEDLRLDDQMVVMRDPLTGNLTFRIERIKRPIEDEPVTAA